MSIPCKNCLLLAMCRLRKEVNCIELESYFINLPIDYNSTFDKIHEILPIVHKIKGNGLSFADNFQKNMEV